MIWFTQHVWGPGVIVLFGAKVKTRGLENIQKEANYLLMVNHSSFLDIPVLGKEIPIIQHYIAKKELKRIPLLGWFMHIAGMIFIDRSNNKKARESIAKAALLIAKSKSVVIFPEGTASRDGTIGKFKKGGFHLALQSKAPVLPIRIQGTGEIWPRGKILKSKRGNVMVTVGKPITYDEYGAWTISEFAENTRQTLVDMGA